jgi:hypothetical protein
MPASNNYTLNHPILPVDGNARASANFGLNKPILPVDGNTRASASFGLNKPVLPTDGNARASASFGLLVDFNTDGENTILFDTVADGMVMSAMDVFADAAVNIQFDTDDVVVYPAQLVTADNTIEFDSQADEAAIFVGAGLSTLELDGQASEIAELGLDASNTVQLSGIGNSTIEVSAETTVNFTPVSAVAPDIDVLRIILHGSEYHQKDNITGPQGGAVECTRKMAIGPVPFQSSISLISTSVADIGQIYIVEGLGQNRIVEREAIMLDGVNQVSTMRTFTRLCRVTKQSGPPIVGDVTVSAGPSIIGVMDSMSGQETTEVLSFLASAMGRATVNTAFYEKFFIKNSTGQDIGKMTISEHQSDFKERVLFAADPTLDDITTSRNRLTKPGGVNPGDFLTDGNLMFNNIPNGSAVGIWLRLVVPAGEGTVLNGWKIKIVADNVTKIYDLLHPEGSGLAFATTLANRDLHPIGGGNPTRYVELAGGKFVQQVYYEPDPITFRDQFYYNARQNRLFKKLNTKPTPVWKIVR